ncbi:MAG: hypothetical protein OXN86_14400 [Chloroflexota bacterium]|nr:hypothetical protein [Chloroflexota bacterium]
MTTQPDHDARHERLEADVAALGQRVALILDGINNLSDRIEMRFTALDQRLNDHDQRFDQLDQRLNGIDRRLDRHDQRFDQLDQRTEDIARHLGVPKRNGRA